MHSGPSHPGVVLTAIAGMLINTGAIAQDAPPPAAAPFGAVAPAGPGVPPAVEAPVDAPPVIESPVFVNESPAAQEGWARLQELVRAGATDQAAALCSRLLNDESGSLIIEADDRSLYRPLRDRLHELMLSDAKLLERFRATRTLLAEESLAAGQAESVERSAQLTRPGLTATLELARRDLGAGRFGSCRRRLEAAARHPDLASVKDEAGAIASDLARFHDAARAIAGQLGAGGLVPSRAPIDEAKRAPGADVDASIDWGALVARPLWQREIAPEDLSAPASGPRWLAGSARVLESLPPAARDLRIVPLTTDDLVIVQRDHALVALDASTLREVWSHDVHPPGIEGAETRSSVDAEELSTPAIAGGLILSTLTRDSGRSEWGDQEIVAVDARTGRQRWSVGAGEIDPTIGPGALRGAILVDADTAVVGIRKRVPERRLAALYLAGIDIASGRTRWSTLIGASGLLPFAAGSPIVDSGIIDDGIVYRSDRLGVVCAVEASTGRVQWVRRLPIEMAPVRAGMRSAAWQQHAPVLIEGSLFLITPDRTEILRLATKTGRVEARSTTDAFFAPSYLLTDGTRLLAVSDARVTSVKAADFGDQRPIRTTGVIEAPGIWGRVRVDQGRMLVPLVSGLAIFDPADLSSPRSVVRLDRPGNPMLVGEQLLVTDDSRVLVYSDWLRAEHVLSKSIEDRPTDPSPAIALLELAARTGRLARAVQAVDAASAAIKARDAGGVGAGVAGAAASGDGDATRLWDVAVSLVDSQLARSQRDSAAKNTVIAPEREVREVLDRLGTLASTPSQRVTHTLLDAQLLIQQNRLADAIVICQRVLADDAMSAAQVVTPRSTARADSESTRRLEQCIRLGGRADYAPFEAQAAAQVQALLAQPSPASPEEFEAVARRYPVAFAASRAWSLASGAHDKAGQARAAARAAESGLLAADRVGDAPVSESRELAGRLVTNLQRRGLVVAAAEALTRHRTRHPGEPMTLDGRALDPETLGRELASLLALERRPARVGAPVGVGASVVPGWTLMEPLRPLTSTTPTSFFVMQHNDGRIALMAPVVLGTDEPGGGEEKSAPRAGGLAPIWVSPQRFDRAALVRQSRTSALFVWPGDGDTASGPLLMRVDAGEASTQLTWRTGSLSSYFSPSTPISRGMNQPFRTPIDGFRAMNEVVVAGDERTLVMVERSGRSVAFDAESGERLWAAPLPITRVLDAALISGTMVVAGEPAPQPGQPVVPGGGAIISIIDARTGEQTRQIESTSGPVRWMRLTTRGDLLVGTEMVVMSIDTVSGRVEWKLETHPAARTVDAWVAGESLIVLTPERQLWTLSIATGEPSDQSLETRGRIEATSRVFVSPTDAGFAVRTTQGLALFDGRGVLKGLDALDPSDGVLPPLPVVGGFATVSYAAVPTRDSPYSVFNVMVLDDQSAMLTSTTPVRLGTYPSAIGAIDGVIAISAGQNTIVYPAPSGQR